MIQFLKEIDHYIIVAINSCNSPFWDEIMWWVSAKITWFPLYIILLYLAYKKLKMNTFLLFIVFVVASVAIADIVSVHLFKDVFLRYRPSHNLLLTDRLHFYEIKHGEWYKGGQYGFVSSHATNYFAIATSVLLVLNSFYPKLKWVLLAIGVLICYSRMYLGVHYLSDIIAGAMLGSLIAYLLYRFAFLPISNSKKFNT